ncbi:hypothetical protein [Streptomyces sp. NBC_00470]|uniref:hypothetical protein n=1 Tax=Streptomyces sp. NBC_00470 TaxID=2975753 RepID=UPI002F9174C6
MSTTKRRRQKSAQAQKPRGAGHTKAHKPTVVPDRTAVEKTAPPVLEQADPVLADAADRAADLRDRAAEDAAYILAVGKEHAAELLEQARSAADSITVAATSERARILAAAEVDADQVRTEAAAGASASAEQVLADADVKAEELLVQARRQAGELTTAATAQADEVRAEAAEAATKVLGDADRGAAEIRDRAAGEAAQMLEKAQASVVAARAEADRIRTEGETAAAAFGERAASDADRLRQEVRAETSRLRQDTERACAAARADAERAGKLAQEDIARLQKTAEEDAARLLRDTREEADQLLAEARKQAEKDLAAAENALAEASEREKETSAATQASEELTAKAEALMQRATSRTEQSLKRKQLRAAARDERRERRDIRRKRQQELRAAARAGKPGAADRIKKFVKVNAERLMVIGPITAPMAVAWTGQAGFAEDILDWMFPFTILFAAAWELSTAFVGWMYHQARRGGDAGVVYRVSTWIFALGAAVMNFWHASGEPVPGSRVWDAQAQVWTEQMTYWHLTPKAVSFAAMSIVGMVLWELYASLIHRRKLRADGKVGKARPSIGAVRWVRYPVHSYTAWSLAITDPSLTTLDRAWAAAGAHLAVQKQIRAAKDADRDAVRTGRALHRVVVPRVRTADHGPASIPTVLTITRTDRPGPAGNPGPDHPVHRNAVPVQHARAAVPAGPQDRTSDHGPVQGRGHSDRTAGPTPALEPGRTGRQGADLQTGTGPDHKSKDRPAPRTQPSAHSVPDRTAVPDQTGPPGGPERNAGDTPPQETDRTPDRTVITLTDLERTALDRLRTDRKTLNRTNIAAAVRTEGGTIATDRAGQIAVALKQQTVR